MSDKAWSSVPALNLVRRGLASVHYRFGDFLLQPDRRCLIAAGVPVSLSTRALDLLTLLIERRERVVTKDEILAAVWSGTAVEENNLAVQVSALRRVLGRDPDGGQYIATVPGRGYRFVAPLDGDLPPRPADDLASPPATAPASPPRRSLRLAALLLVLVLPVAASLAWLLSPPQPVGAPRLSLVVLPFRNLNGDAARDYLADALSDDISTDLSHLAGSVIIARGSAESFRNKSARPEEIGRALNVRYLLYGSVLWESSGVHVNAQLIAAADGRQLWATGFDVPQDALGAARDEIVRRLAAALDFTLFDIESARSLHERPDNADAVDYLLRARHLLDGPETLPSLTTAEALLEHAVALAPAFADAQALLATVLLRKIGGFLDPDDAEDHARARQAVQAALAASPQNPLALTAKGLLGWLDDRCRQAEFDFRRALSLDSASVPALLGLAACMRSLGQMQDMVQVLQAVLRIDPASPRTPIRQNLVGLGLLMLGKPAEAINWLDRAAVEVAPKSAPSLALSSTEWNRVYLIAATELVGDHAGAAARYAEYDALWPHRTVWQLASYDTHARAALPAYPAYLAALHAAGMPIFADENAKPDATTVRERAGAGDLSLTPLGVAGGKRVDTATVASLLSAAPMPLILDVGTGSAAIPGAALIWQRVDADDEEQVLLAAAAQPRAPGAPIIVMGDGPTDWVSYDAALKLIARHVGPVLWYRGGEEAWAASGRHAEDKRLQ